MSDEDPELVRLDALNARLEALYPVRWRDDGTADPTVNFEIDALEAEAAALIRARTDRALKPLTAAVVQGHRLLSLPCLERRAEASCDFEVELSGCAAIGVGGYHSDHYADPDDGLCQWCGDVAPHRR